MNQINIEQVTKTYTDRRCSGCYQTYVNRESNMCGCNGKFALPSTVRIEDANKVIGYDCFSDNDVSDIRVNETLNKVNDTLNEYENLLIDGEYEDERVCIERTDKYVYVQVDEYINVIYF